MSDENKTREELAAEVQILRRRIADLERTETTLPKAEISLKVSEEQYQAIFNTAAVGITVVDRSGLFVHANAALCGMLGYTLEELRNLTVIDVTYPDDVRDSRESLRLLAAGQIQSYRLEKRYVTKSGQVLWTDLSVSAVRESNGSFLAAIGITLDITDRKRAEEDLRGTSARLSSLLDNLPDAVTFKDAQGRYLLVNRAFEKCLALERTEILGKTGDEFLPSYFAKWHWISDTAVLRTGRPALEEYREDGHTDRKSVIEFRKFPVFDDEGHVMAIGAIARNVTKAKLREEELREKTRLNQALLDAFPCVALLIRPQTREIVASNAAAMKVGAVPGKQCFATWGQRENPCPWCLAPDMWATGKPRHLEVEALGVVWDAHWIPVEPDLYMHYAFDVTERKRTEEELLQSEQRLELALKGADLGLWDWDVRQDRAVASEQTARLAGYTLDEIDASFNFLLSIMHPDDKKRVSETLGSHLRGETASFEEEFRVKHKSGEWKWIMSRGAVLSRDHDGLPLRMAGTFLDITPRKQSELASKLLAAAVEHAAEAIMITDSQGNIEYVNPAFERVTGYTREEILGEKPCLLTDSDCDTEFYRQLSDACLTGNGWAGRLVKKRKDGSRYEEDTTVSPIRDSSGTITNFIAVKRDVTQEIQLQAQLLQAQKMEAVGTLAGGVAHDFNNLLQVVLGYSELVLEDESLAPHHRGDLERINLAARNGADLVQRLLIFSRKTSTTPMPTNLNHRINQIQSLLRRTIPRMIEIELTLAEDLHAVNVDPTQLDQVVMNLAVNARDAMPKGGKLTIRTANTLLDEQFARTRLGSKPGPYVLLSVTDTGAGMDQRTLDHLFEPFFTTKGPGEGTGLGLAMVYGIVKLHGAHILCSSETSKGTTFDIYFPALVSKDEADDLSAPSLPRGGQETILLVEDEDLIRELGKRILEKVGYEVLTAVSGREALDIYNKNKEKVALVILDVIMPEMGGSQCLEELLKINPAVKVVVTTGYASDGPTTAALQAGAKAFSDKPYETRQLLQTVRDVLDGD